MSFVNSPLLPLMATLCSSRKTLRAYSKNSHRSARSTKQTRETRESLVVGGGSQKQNRLGGGGLNAKWKATGLDAIRKAYRAACSVANRLITQNHGGHFMQAVSPESSHGSSRSVALREGTVAFE